MPSILGMKIITTIDYTFFLLIFYSKEKTHSIKG